MLEGRHPPPEKQLLNLIEQGKAGEEIKPKVQRKKFGLLSFFSLGGLKGRASFYQSKSHHSVAASEGALNIKGVNRGLQAVVIALALYLASSFGIAYEKLQEMPGLNIDIKLEGQEKPIEIPSLLKKLPFYLEQARARDIFNPITLETVAESKLSEEQQKAKTKIEEASEILTLSGIGISVSGEPDAMIKDEERDRVYFLKRGDTIRDLRVDAIFKDSVVLTYNGEELILR